LLSELTNPVRRQLDGDNSEFVSAEKGVNEMQSHRDEMDGNVPKDRKSDNPDIKQLTRVRMGVEKQEMDLQSPLIIA
jgi:hypothetical protein